MISHPTVTIAIPAYNEAAHIESVITGFLNQQYPGLVEILIADGGSTDGTQDILNQIAAQNPIVKLVHNPQKIQSHALNIMLKEAKGDIFLRSDAHCIYANDYIASCVKALLNSEALNVGGAQRFIAKTPFQSGVALASKSRLGNGGAKYRDPNYNGYAETVFIGCFWRKALEEVSGYSTEAVTNQDAELNLRLLEKTHKAIYVSSEIKVWYFPRKTPKSLWTQFFRYGRGRYITARRHPGRSPLRSKIPSIAVVFWLISVILLGSTVGFVPATLLIIITALIPLIESIRLTLQYKNNFNEIFWRGNESDTPSLFARCFYCWIALLIMPIAYTTGGFFQLIRHRLFKVEGW
jgi:glycosyltransferase involved in cell wall biosynthesis